MGNYLSAKFLYIVLVILGTGMNHTSIDQEDAEEEEVDSWYKNLSEVTSK